MEKPWNPRTALKIGPAAPEAWEHENSTPPLDSPVKISDSQGVLLAHYVNSVPSEEETYTESKWSEITAKGDSFIIAMGCLYQAAHAYVKLWRETREPTTLTPEGLGIFRGGLMRS